MLGVLVLHLVVAAVVLALAPTLGRRVMLVAALAPLGTGLWAATQVSAVLDGETVQQSYRWVDQLGLVIDLRLNAFSLVMVSLIAAVGTCVFVYASAYFGDRPDLGRFGAPLVLFAGAMVGLVLADDLLLLFVFWELTSVTSYLLIGFEDEKAAARGAALQAILVTGAGGLVMLAGFVLLGQAAGTWQLSELLADPPTGSTVGVALVLVLVGAFTKSAQVPFHFWLPAAMSAPTPVSAFLHSATMVKAGVYLIAVLAPAFATEPVWRPTVLVVGSATMLLGGYRALRQHDIKLLLAFGTVSQLGFLVILFGIGTPETTFAGIVMLIAHATFKAGLFLVVGIVDHEAHTRDLRRLYGLARAMPYTFVVAAVAAASMAGLPPLLGFIGKESALESLLHVHAGWGPAVLAVVVVGSILTFAYTARFMWGTFATEPTQARTIRSRYAVTHDATAWMVAPAALIAAPALVFGLLPFVLKPLVVDAAASLGEAVEDPSLSLWHGFNAALGLSAIIIGTGVVLFLRRRTVERVQAMPRRSVEAAAGYRQAITTLNDVADRTTGVVQSGSLPVYLGIILMTLVLLPGSALVLAAAWPEELQLASSWLQVVVSVAVVLAAVAAARARRRLVAVLLLGGVGYGVAVLFMVQGAPDLALTQLLVETLAVVIFALVLRHLPDRFEPQTWRIAQVPRLLVAAAVGVFVTAAALVMGNARQGAPISVEHLARALPEGGGKNVVNVILVDFRGFDTLGEITVIAVAALGVLTLVRAGRRSEEEVP